MRRRPFIAFAGASLLAAPYPANAQKAANATIGLLTTGTLDAGGLAAVKKGLAERGYVEGRNVTFIARAADGNYERLPALAAELAAANVSVILGVGGPFPARAAKAITTTIPIVFAYGGDPILDGLVASYNRPGGNVTGATFLGTTLSGKRIQILRDLLPRVADVALLVNPKSSLAPPQIKDAEAAAKSLNVRLHIVNASTADEIDAAFDTMVRVKVDAHMLSTDPSFGLVHTRQIIAQAARTRIPTIYPTRIEADDGGLISYGASFYGAVRQAAGYAGRILDGEKPADLPVMQPTSFELVINLKSAKALGLAVPSSLLAVADEVIE
jgi:putative ABC transport system substrate-binding protein